MSADGGDADATGDADADGRRDAGGTDAGATGDDPRGDGEGGDSDGSDDAAPVGTGGGEDGSDGPGGGDADPGDDAGAPGGDGERGPAGPVRDLSEHPAVDGEGASLVLRERRTAKGLLVSVCDPDALGETYEEGPVTLAVTEEFYGGDPADPAAVRESLARASVGNLVGARAVELAVEVGVVDEENVMTVEGTPHAQFLTL